VRKKVRTVKEKSRFHPQVIKTIRIRPFSISSKIDFLKEFRIVLKINKLTTIFGYSQKWVLVLH